MTRHYSSDRQSCSECFSGGGSFVTCETCVTTLRAEIERLRSNLDTQTKLAQGWERGFNNAANEVERLRGALRKYGDHLYVDADGTVFDMYKHGGRHQDFNRCPDRWATHCACGLEAALSPTADME